MKSLFAQVIRPVYWYACYVSSQLGDRRLGIRTTDERVALESGQDYSEYRTVPGGIHRAWSFTGNRQPATGA